MVVACLKESITQVNLPVIIGGKRIQAKRGKIKQKLNLFFSVRLVRHRFTILERESSLNDDA